MIKPILRFALDRETEGKEERLCSYIRCEIPRESKTTHKNETQNEQMERFQGSDASYGPSRGTETRC